MLIFETDDSSYEPETNLIAIEKKIWVNLN